ISYKINNVDEFYEAFFMDKKSSNKKINFVLASPLGKGFIKGDISKEDIIATLREFQ
ncbi:3-dehydroquinate synthase, partial [Campylobacter jejuni]|nr:3-dehydroquinate synthase [Campylobacter jejuni]